MAAGAVVHRLRMALVALRASVLAVLGDMRVAGAGQVGGQSHEVVAGHDGTVSVGVATGVQAELVVFSATSSNELADVAGLEDSVALLDGRLTLRTAAGAATVVDACPEGTASDSWRLVQTTPAV